MNYITQILLLLLTIMAGVFAINGFVLAAEESPVILVIHNQQFDPNTLTLSEGVKMKLVVRNLDSMPVEFESYELSREVIVPGHGEVTIYVGPLAPEIYQFINEYNPRMHGSIVVKPVVNKGS